MKINDSIISIYNSCLYSFLKTKQYFTLKMNGILYLAIGVIIGTGAYAYSVIIEPINYIRSYMDK